MIIVIFTTSSPHPSGGGVLVVRRTRQLKTPQKCFQENWRNAGRQTDSFTWRNGRKTASESPPGVTWHQLVTPPARAVQPNCRDRPHPLDAVGPEVWGRFSLEITASTSTFGEGGLPGFSLSLEHNPTSASRRHALPTRASSCPL